MDKKLAAADIRIVCATEPLTQVRMHQIDTQIHKNGESDHACRASDARRSGTRGLTGRPLAPQRIKQVTHEL